MLKNDQYIDLLLGGKPAEATALRQESRVAA
jgi:hypothetical protein